MEEIKVGEYVRTISGNIDKVDALIGTIENTVHLEKHKWQDIKNIVKHSPNIIDLIEVGDFVNGEEITEITTDPFVKGQINLWTDIELRDVYGDYDRLKYTVSDIKNIVTKEQFNQVKYEV